MVDTKKVEEDLKKLENQAYFELCQIIAEAIELQDVDLLNTRIASWKNKYKKLLDRPSTNSKSDFKKRIEYLLTQYYSEITQYILAQLKLKEEKVVQKQSKALRELYTIIRDTNDYDLLKKKVNKWKEKYPTSGFLKMYQKRIELQTRDKNLRENAFEQEEAFRDLVDITKIHGTLDELKNKLTLWEDKYSINDKYKIDDFLKHQTEVKRYTSDEFLQSIAREEFNPNNIDKTEIDLLKDYNNNSFANLSIQASSYASLLKISKLPNSVDEMFMWVYKNRGIKFNDKYKELILNATYLNYSPSYLNKISKPQIDMSKSSLTFDEYINIGDIKKYAIISYFNLLLPPGKSIANNFFNNHIHTIYAKTEKSKVSNITNKTISISNNEAKPKPQPNEKIIVSTDLEETSNSENITPSVENDINPEIIIDLSSIEPKLTIDLTKPEENILESKNNYEEIVSDDKSKIIIDLSYKKNESTNNILNNTKDNNKSNPDDLTVEMKSAENNESEGTLDYSTVVAFSPLFFEEIYNYNKQAVLINYIDNTVTKYAELESKEVSLDEPIKTKIDED